MRLRNIPGADEAVASSPYCIQISGKLIVNQLQAYIVRNFFDDAGFYPIFFNSSTSFFSSFFIKQAKLLPSKICILTPL